MAHHHLYHNPQYYTLHHPTKHCPTCNCQNQQAFFQWKNQQPATNQPNMRVSRLLQSRIIPPGDPVSMEVGDHVIPNKVVWFKSVSPRPNKITIRVSSPQRPNLRPSQVSGSAHKRSPSEQSSNLRGFQLSRVSIAESNPLTPIRQIAQKGQYSLNQQSTMYSPPGTDRKTVQNTQTSMTQYI